MSKNKIETALYVTLGFIILWLFMDREEKIKEIKVLKTKIDENESLNDAVKTQLKDLIQNSKEIEPAIANELGQIAALIEINQEAGAVFKMTKIIENLLIKLFKKDEEFKEYIKRQNRKQATFGDYIEFAKSKGLISKDDYHIVNMMKNIRNEEAHQLDVKKDKTKILVSFVSGMSLIIGLSKTIKKSLESVA